MSTVFNNTKIIATVGPASNTKEKLLELIIAGVNVFRLNFSHGAHEDHLKVIEAIKDLNKTFNYNITILQDLQGPKIRIGTMKEGSELKEGDDFMLTTKQEIEGDSTQASTSYTALPRDVKAGDSILIDDGKIELRVYKVSGQNVHTKVVYGGVLRSRKGMNLPDTDISEPSLTKKDNRDLEFGLEHDVDWVAISFVRTPGDVLELKRHIKEQGKKTKVIAKIERPEAIKNIKDIVKAADALMVARGDLGVEIQMEEVPLEQKRIVTYANEAAKPVIIATQMMESMIENPRPTRAEANDVANAVLDGADAVMLSGETAMGKFPVQTIQHMTNIIRVVEQNMDNIYNKYYEYDPLSQHFGSNILVETSTKLANKIGAKAIIGITDSGFTAFRLARHRPKADIFIFTSNKDLLSTLNLVWGVRAFFYNKEGAIDNIFADFEKILVKEGLLRKGDVYVNTGSLPLGGELHTNMMKFQIVE
ncbi:pyruvate kinase [Flammeovirgaceae bacterium SG7u.111]|nr:pyruvate kinase [Flammeovirgaceae bacterium SG7u.132]WPO37388.1 pyruvate kinase [Flammeovirgaceae bacterium SG7u.111]